MSELKPCPFCGAKARQACVEPYRSEQVVCSRCDGSNDTVEGWDRRAIPPEVGQSAETMAALQAWTDAHPDSVIQDGIAGPCNIVHFDGEDVVGVCHVGNPLAHRLIAAALKDAQRVRPPSVGRPVAQEADDYADVTPENLPDCLEDYAPAHGDYPYAAHLMRQAAKLLRAAPQTAVPLSMQRCISCNGSRAYANERTVCIDCHADWVTPGQFDKNSDAYRAALAHPPCASTSITREEMHRQLDSIVGDLLGAAPAQPSPAPESEAAAGDARE